MKLATWNIQSGESKDHNGFRLDYIYVSEDLKSRIKTSEILHEARLNKISDHSIVVTQIDI